MNTFPASNNHISRPSDWAPSCSLALLRERSRVIRTIRSFFEDRGVLEVETPILTNGGPTDPNLHSFRTAMHLPGGGESGTSLYLHTSPEFAMKRLLAAGSGSIFQVCKVFRDEELGRFHNPEFTLLEWYRVGLTLKKLIGETEALIHTLFSGHRVLDLPEVLPYSEVFRRHVGIEPVSASIEDFGRCAKQFRLVEAEDLCGDETSVWLDFIFSHLVQPHLGHGRLSFITDYPALLSSLARNKPGNASLVERVEVFLGGMELGNGFQELQDAFELERRFDVDLQKRRQLGLPEPSKDERLILALKSGLPSCAGIAIGIDRLLMLLTGAKSIDEVLPFPIERA